MLSHRYFQLFAKTLMASIILIIGFIFFWGSKWLQNVFGELPFEQVLYHILVPLDGTPSDIIWSFISYCLPFSVLPAFIIISVWLLIVRYTNNLPENEDSNKTIIKRTSRFAGKHIISICTLVMFILIFYSAQNMGMPEFIELSRASTTIFEKEYKDPRKTKVVFPEQPRNLIVLFMESMEVAYTSNEYGGNQEQNFIPYLTKIAADNISFSNGTTVGGTYDMAGFTTPGLFTQLSGLPLKTTLDVNGGAFKNEFFPGAFMLGDILETQGYKQVVMFGSDAKFGTRDKMFKGHGDFEIFDLYTARERGYIPSDYNVWWGFEDRKLFEYLKIELRRLASYEEPFCLVALTVDTHHFDGFICPLCKNIHDEQFNNVIQCSDKQIGDFIKWLQAQEFYENTTIALLGDHLCMNTHYFQDNGYERRVFNAFINSPVQPVNEKNRVFTSLDIFPTILAAMGVQIEGDRLGLGVNLFSDKPSLSQYYGPKAFNYEIRKNSFFYNTNILDPTDYIMSIATSGEDFADAEESDI